jgi:hypothetical protein
MIMGSEVTKYPMEFYLEYESMDPPSLPLLMCENGF